MKLTSVGRSTSSSETDEKSNSDASALIQYAPEINVEAVVSKMQDAFC
jgi:type III secretory pathway lipoprotein EscJ